MNRADVADRYGSASTALVHASIRQMWRKGYGSDESSCQAEYLETRANQRDFRIVTELAYEPHGVPRRNIPARHPRPLTNLGEREPYPPSASCPGESWYRSGVPNHPGTQCQHKVNGRASIRRRRIGPERNLIVEVFPSLHELLCGHASRRARVARSARKGFHAQ